MKRLRVAVVVAALMAGLLATIGLASPLRAEKRAKTGLTIRWDIIHFDATTSPPTLTPGGVASALSADGTKITLTGSGTFGGPPTKVTGGGDWTTYDASGAQTGSGTYKVLSLVSFIAANMQSQTPPLNDQIGDTNKRANGAAVLRIAFSDGSQGVLTIDCHGPGAPPGLFEGIATTKSYRTYYTIQLPSGTVDANRTIFHLGV